MVDLFVLSRIFHSCESISFVGKGMQIKTKLKHSVSVLRRATSTGFMVFKYIFQGYIYTVIRMYFCHNFVAIYHFKVFPLRDPVYKKN